MGFCALLKGILWLLSSDPELVEKIYSNGWYPLYSYVPKFIFGWLPVSAGDIFYTLVGAAIFFWASRLIWRLVRTQWSSAYVDLLRVTSCVFVLYVFFYASWGMNYYRQPLSVSFSLPVDSISREDYYGVLEKYIAEANALRSRLDTAALSRDGVREQLEKMMQASTPFDGVLSKTQVKGKYPLSSTLVSYFLVTGYFNPFTHEVQVNRNSPLVTYPFTTVHELAHQMGIGFEDECNFIAFRMLVAHQDPWYRYSAYYEAIQSLLRPVRFWDEEAAKRYVALLDDGIKADLQEEQLFWASYRGVIDTVTKPFYNAFLQHNNQPEGTGRYSMMNRLIVAWEISGKEKL